MQTRRTYESTKQAFLKTWPGGYAENFEVYTKQAGRTELEIVDTCLKPFYNPAGTAIEIGCGKGFWVSRHLLPNFKEVIGVDIIPPEWTDLVTDKSRFRYVEAGDNDYYARAVADNSVDFLWSFGVFCHLCLDSIQKYLHTCHRIMKPGPVLPCISRASRSAPTTNSPPSLTPTLS